MDPLPFCGNRDIRVLSHLGSLNCSSGMSNANVDWWQKESACIAAACQFHALLARLEGGDGGELAQEREVGGGALNMTVKDTDGDSPAAETCRR